MDRPESSTPPHTSPPTAVTDSAHDVQINIFHHGKALAFSFPVDSTISDLSDTISGALAIPPSNQKFMVTPKIGLLKPPFKDPSLSLDSLASKKITLIGSTFNEISSLDDAAFNSRSRSVRRSGRLLGPSPGVVKPATPSRHRDWQRAQEEATYTFTTLRPLPYLPNPDRSLHFLERLRDDPGIKASMRKHRWTVPLLTEMNPAEHTTHESRTLGLNRNRGEVIELRLRTDAYDGYRDYKTIRKTLCHELTHNVWGEHDRNFWDLCREVEKEVERGDWKSGGHALTEQEFYNPDDDGIDDEEIADHGGWTGGEYVLGSNSGTGSLESSVTGGEVSAGSLNRREVLAKAAEERLKRQKQVGQPNGSTPKPS
ncbi:MAG: hypothetical protein M1819_005140 [Sarea resinae]|nr:MAG: hypothetical protein M1819_005140 [Sarea resinae]